jgi:hypothetical protein
MKETVMLLKANLVKQRDDLASIELWQNFLIPLKQLYHLFSHQSFCPASAGFTFFLAFSEEEVISLSSH